MAWTCASRSTNMRYCIKASPLPPAKKAQAQLYTSVILLIHRAARQRSKP